MYIDQLVTKKCNEIFNTCKKHLPFIFKRRANTNVKGNYLKIESILFETKF